MLRVFIPCIDLHTTTTPAQIYTPSCASQSQNVFTILPQLYNRLSHLEIPTEYQYLTSITMLIPTNTFIDTIMDAEYPYHAFTYIPQQHRYKSIHDHAYPSSDVFMIHAGKKWNRSLVLSIDRSISPSVDAFSHSKVNNSIQLIYIVTFTRAHTHTRMCTEVNLKKLSHRSLRCNLWSGHRAR